MLDASQVAFPDSTYLEVSEGVGAVPLTVVRTGDLSGPASVRVRTESSQALAGLDYVPLDFVLGFAPGQGRATFSLTILDDEVSETYGKIINVRLDRPVVAELGSRSSTVVGLVDDEPGSSSDLAFLNFGPEGLWTFNDAEGFRKINDASPEAIVPTADRGAYLDFGPYGLWEWDALRGFRKLSDVDPEAMVGLPSGHPPIPQFAAGVGPIWDEPALVIDFGHGGLWALGESSGAWRKINDASPRSMVGSGYSVLLDYGPQGLWSWETFLGGWTKLNDAAPEAMASDDGRATYFDYGPGGVWTLANGGWRKLSDADPQAIAAGRGVLYADFGAYGLWSATRDGGWSKLTDADPRSMAVTSAGLYVDFGDAGFWRYDAYAPRWDILNAVSPEAIAFAYPDDVLLDYGDWGLWRWDAAAGLRKINGADVALMAVVQP